MDDYRVHATNPNDRIGGGGSLVTGSRPDLDNEGPWIEFFRVSTEYDASPYAVISLGTLQRIAAEAPFQEVVAADDELPERIARRQVLTREDTGLPPNPTQNGPTGLQIEPEDRTADAEPVLAD